MDLRIDPPSGFGKREVWITTRTGNKATAALRAAPIIAGLKAKADELRGRAGSVDADALWWRETLRKTRDENPDMFGATMDDFVRVAAEKFLPKGVQTLAVNGVLDRFHGDELEAVSEMGGPKAKRFLQVAAGRTVPTVSLIDIYMTRRKTEVEAKTASMDEADLRAFAAEFPTVDTVSRASVMEWTEKLIAGGVKPATVQRKLTPIRRYWAWLQDRGDVPSDAPSPFEKMSFKAKAKDVAQSSWLPFTPNEVAKLYGAALEKDDKELADVIRIAAYTGARIEEVCSLTVESIQLQDKTIAITDSKTEAGIRIVPAHKQLTRTLKRLLGDRQTGFLLADLAAETKFKDRSGAVSKRFGRLKTAQGFSDRHVFHSIRKCATTQFERAGISENVAADIVGHEKPRITYGLYSGGSSMEQKQTAVEMISYPAPLG